jgi:hypothetical protein
MYQVGFGDCFLVSIEYDGAPANARAERHILFDLGSTSGPRTGRVTMASVADLIAEHTHGKLDVVVLTHRHRDHMLGFGDDHAADVFRKLAPKVVLRPWTEDPVLPADATGPALSARNFAAQLAEAQSAAERIATVAVRGRTGARHELQGAALEQLPNQEAVTMLNELSADKRGQYLHAGKAVRMQSVVPGLRVTVLGPPTVDQDKRVARQVSRNPEYWMLRLQQSLTAAVPTEVQPPADVPPGQVRWLVEHLAKHQTHSMARLVQALDDAMNNTSLILLLEVGQLSMLFPGDAQIENWQFTLEKLAQDKVLRDKLAAIDLYKVGHHGSRNATPRSLHALWTQRPAGAPALTALMSTKAGVHGHTAKTKVPRQTLVNALKEVATLFSTDDLSREEPFLELVAPVTGGPFKPVVH